jgi:hypothetical protein
MKRLVFLLLLLPLWASAEWLPLAKEDTLDVYWDPDTLMSRDANRTVLILINNLRKTKQDKEASVIAQAELNCDKHVLRYQGSKSYTRIMGKGTEISELATSKYTTWFKVPPSNYFESFLMFNACRN